MPRFLSSSTLLCSSIFAVVAGVDAGTKESRSRQWDAAIAGVQGELAQVEMRTKSTMASDMAEQERMLQDQPQSGTERPLAALANKRCEDRLERRAQTLAQGRSNSSCANEASPYSSAEATESSKSGNDREDGAGFMTFDDQNGEEDSLQYLDPARQARAPANSGPPINRFRLPPQSIYQDPRIKALASMTWSPKKLAKVETVMERFQLQILRELDKRGWSDEAARAVPDEYAELLSLRGETLIDLLKSNQRKWSGLVRTQHHDLSDYEGFEEGLTLCRYAQDSAGEHRLQTRRLNRSLSELFDLYTKEEISKPALLAQIARNLSYSSAPPDVNTFSTLFFGLSRAHENRLFKSLLNGFRRCSMRPNELSHISILNHYVRHDDDRGFARWLGIMRGKHGGPMLASPSIVVTDVGRKRLIPHPEINRYIQLPYPTPDVFRAVIEGMVKFSSFDKAVAICEYMREQDWGLCIGGLTPLLRDCARRADWTSGVTIWKQIQTLRGRETRRAAACIGLDPFAAMLRLCTVCGQRETFDTVWSQAINTHRDAGWRLMEAVRAGECDRRAEDTAAADAVERQHDRRAEHASSDSPVDRRPVGDDAPTHRTSRAHAPPEPRAPCEPWRELGHAEAVGAA